MRNESSLPRREFLIGAVAGGLAGTMMSVEFAAGKAAKARSAGKGRKASILADKPSQDAAVHYSLRGIAGQMGKFRVPGGDFRPSESWALEYSFPIGSPRASTLTIAKRRSPEGIAYSMTVKQNDGGATLTIGANLDCSNDRRLLKWKSRRLIPEYTAGPIQPVEETAVVSDTGISLAVGGLNILLAAAKPVIPFAGLLDAFACGVPPSGAFTLLDEFLALKPAQSATAGATQAMLKSGAIPLTGYYYFGAGVHPTHVWATDRGLPLFITQGLQSYGLTAIR